MYTPMPKNHDVNKLVTWYKWFNNKVSQWLFGPEIRLFMDFLQSWPLDDLDLFYGKGNIGRSCIWMEKIVKMSFEGENLKE